MNAESSFLGAVFQDPSYIYETQLRAEHFEDTRHYKIFYVMNDLKKRNIPIDYVAVATRMGDKIEQVGGVSYLVELEQSVPTTKNMKYYETVILEEYQKRKFGQLTEELRQSIQDGKTIEEVLSQAKEEVNAIEDECVAEDDGLLTDVMLEYVNDLAEGKDTGIPTKLTDLDSLMNGGFRQGELIIIAARPGMGKTALGLNILSNMADVVHDGHKMLPIFFSLEMGRKELVGRLISSIGGVDGMRMKKSNLNAEDWEKVSLATGILQEKEIRVFDNSMITVDSIWATIRKQRRNDPTRIPLIIVDYIQLISGTKGNNRQEEVAYISRMLKIIAKTENAVVIALSQLSRENEKRQNKRPIPSDLRESGAIEQDADKILFIYSEQVYDPESEKKTTELIMSKQRNGSQGTVEVLFRKEISTFVNLERKY